MYKEQKRHKAKPMQPHEIEQVKHLATTTKLTQAEIAKVLGRSAMAVNRAIKPKQQVDAKYFDYNKNQLI